MFVDKGVITVMRVPKVIYNMHEISLDDQIYYEKHTNIKKQIYYKYQGTGWGDYWEYCTEKIFNNYLKN